MKPGRKLVGRVAALYVGDADGDDLSKRGTSSVSLELDGIVGDRHRGHARKAWAGGDKEAEGTVRRNERQWSGMSLEEIAQIARNMNLDRTLDGADLGANICFEGLAEFSQLPKGSVFTFSSGAKLVAVEYNPPCIEMGAKLATKYCTRSGPALEPRDFAVAAVGLRGLVGVVDVPGVIQVGDDVTVELWSEDRQFNLPQAQGS